MATVASSFLMMMMMMLPFRSISVTCPKSCSTLSPLPYPFGAAPGCGSPGFQMTNCSVSPPEWNLTAAGYSSSYYIKSIGSNPNHSNPQTGPNPSYGYGGTILTYLHPTTDVPGFCEVLNASLNDFTTSNLYAFKDADLSYFEDSYLLLNCMDPAGSSVPDSGVARPSSPSCTKYVNHCNLSVAGYSCIEYIADKELQLSTLKSAYNCTTLRRFLITNDSTPISSWLELTQFAWGPVRHADSCARCQRTGGTCGYDVEDESFRCHCGNDSRLTDCKSGNSKVIAIGSSLAAVVFIIFAGIALYYRHGCYYYGLLAKRKRVNLDGINQAPLKLSYWALSAATNSFGTKIGQGAFGKVYRGLLYDGHEIAVKVLDSSVFSTDEQFVNEMATIGNIHHMNVARLVGFCFRKSKRILVYEYVCNGSLDKYLSTKEQVPEVPILSWKQRFDIALGIARGLAYMHEECRNCIIHCDIKPQNILLDKAFRPKIADFGLARLLSREESKVLTNARGTPGYVAPEFWSLGSGPLSAKFDVYSYGKVLLEIIQGRRGFNNFYSFCREDKAELNSFMSVLIDERMENDIDMEQAYTCTKVALLCIQKDPSMRPTMSGVVQYLIGTAAVPIVLPPALSRTMCGKGDLSQFQEDSSEFPLRYSDTSSSHP